MYRIGLTGGVGSGKSTVSSYMKEFGIPVIDGDCLAMEAVAPGNIAMREIRQVFGNGIFNEDGSLNRLKTCLLYTSPSPRDVATSRMPSSA